MVGAASDTAQRAKPASGKSCFGKSSVGRLCQMRDAYVRSLIYSAQATAYKLLDDFPQAIAAFQELIQYGRAANSLVSELMGRSALALYVMERGQLHFAFEIAKEGVDLVERSGTLPPISAAVYGELGSIYYQWHELEKAHHFLNGRRR
jgi:tetratricopeptide (TPR) repeat protein